MPRGPTPEWRRRKEPVLDDYVFASIAQAGGLGRHDPVTGFYGTLHITGLETKDDAAEYRRALFRAAHHLSRHGIADVSMHVDPIKRDTRGYLLVFRAVDKTLARAHVLRRYGNDRSRWPYDPRARVPA